MIFCECGRIWPCSKKNHKPFDIKTYQKERLKKTTKHSGDSLWRQKQGQFQAKEGR